MANIKCPFCESEDTFEISYLGAHPLLFQYHCTECGVSAPIGVGDTEDQARKDAEYMLIKFIEKIKGKVDD